MKVCSVEDCDRGIWSRAFCGMHYQRWRKHGDPLAVKIQARRDCSVSDCGGRLESHGMCAKHFRRWQTHGDPLYEREMWGEGNPSWRGDSVSYYGAHQRVRAMKGRAADERCEHCSGQALHWAYGHNDPDEKVAPEGPYSADPAHYIPLCVPCHSEFDKSVPYQNTEKTA